jgi:glycerol-3-phosphate O-acyltransferase
MARDLIAETSEGVCVTEDGKAVLTFYANTIAHHFDATAANSAEISAVAE